MGSSRYVRVRVDEVLRETEKALLCRIDGDEVWLPFSQIADPDDYAVGDTDFEMAVTAWIADEKGLEAVE